MKKGLAILLSLALVICMIPATAVTAFAATELNDTMISLSSDSAVYTGKNLLPTVNVAGAKEGDDYTVTWSKDNSQITSAVNVGTYTVTVASTGDSSKFTGSATKNFTINQRDLSTVTVYIPEQEADTNANIASAVKDSISFTAKASGNSSGTSLDLKNDVNISVTDGPNNNNKKATITGNGGNVSGTIADVTFSVKQGISKYHLEGIVSKSYTGSPVTQTNLYLADSSNNKVNISSSYYDLVYSNNTDKGTATVKAVAKSPYVGETEAQQFTITQADATVAYANGNGTLRISDISNQLVNATPAVTVYEVINGKNRDVSASQYQVTYENNTQAGTAYACITFGSDSNYYGTIKKAFTIITGTNNVLNQGDAYIVGASTSNTKSVYYTGATQTVSVNVAKVGATYRVEYRKGSTVLTGSNLPKDAGTYSVYVIGTGNYAGEVLAGYLQIMPIPLDWTEIVLGSSTVYDSASRTYVPKVTLRTKSGYPYGSSGYVTIPETDYNVGYRYVNSSSAYLKPTAYVTVKSGAVNLTNAIDTRVTEVTKEFSIASRNISNCTINFTDYRNSSAYTGTGIKPTVVVRDTSLNRTLTLNSDYTVTYKNAAGKTVTSLVDAGTYSVIVTGAGSYSGSQTLTYTITGKDISGYTVTLKESSVAADGLTKTPVIVSVKNGVYNTLSVNDYTVSYQDSTGKTVTRMSAPGTYKVVVTGKNGYSGSCYATFRIVGKSQTITGVDSTYKVYPTSETFKLTPNATEATGFTYVSSDPTVATVSASGYVTPLKAGRAKITITTTGNRTYDPATYSTVIKVYPTKATMTKKPWNTGKKGQIQVRWNKQDNVTRYEVRYSRSKSFNQGTYITKKVNAAYNTYSTQSTKISKLKSGYTYYVKVRAVKEVTNDYGKTLTYYGKWSNWKSVKVK